MAVLDLTDNVMEHLKELLEENRPTIELALTQHGFGDDTEIKTIIKGAQAVIASYPAIEIVPDDRPSEWFATRVRKETYNFHLDCSIKSLKREVADEFVRVLGTTVQNVLNDFNNLQFDVPDTNVVAYDSFATNVALGYKKEGAIQTARVSWFCFILNSYVEA